LGFALTLEAKRCTQLWLGAQNLASLAAGLVASGIGLTCHVIPLVGSFTIDFFFGRGVEHAGFVHKF
jgi:hypothetical protein